MLADLVDRGNEDSRHPFINMKGYLVGNGCADEAIDGDSLPDFYYYHGLYSEEMRDHILESCKDHDYYNATGACRSSLADAYEQVGNVNPYGEWPRSL